MGSATNLPRKTLFRKIIIADDHLLVSQGICRLIEDVAEEIEVVRSGEELMHCASRAPPDVVIADITMQGISGVDAMIALRDKGVSVPFIFLTMHDEPSVAMSALRAGGRGYLPKTAAGDELVRALEDVVGGRTYIAANLASRMVTHSQRSKPKVSAIQVRILRYVSMGMRNKEIASEMELSVRTIESHKYAMMQELGVHSTLELLNAAKSEGLFEN